MNTKMFFFFCVCLLTITVVMSCRKESSEGTELSQFLKQIEGRWYLESSVSEGIESVKYTIETTPEFLDFEDNELTRSYLDSENTEWKQHPVIHLSLNAEKYENREMLEQMLALQLESWETLYGVNKGNMTYSGRFMTIIKNAYEQMGCSVVVLYWLMSTTSRCIIEFHLNFEKR